MLDALIFLGSLGIAGLVCLFYRDPSSELVSLNLMIGALGWSAWKLTAIHKTLKDIMK